MDGEKKFVIRCRAIILNEGKMLLVRHPHDLSYAALPGGHLEWGEQVQECLQREITEELGVKPQIGRLLYVHTFLDKHNTQPVEFFFEVTNGGDYLKTTNNGSHAHELAEIFWAAPTDAVRILPKALEDDFKSGKILADTVRYITG